MKNKHPKKPAAGVASLVLSEKGNNNSQNSLQKSVIPDECGDSLWNDILEENESNLLANGNGENVQSSDKQDQIKED